MASQGCIRCIPAGMQKQSNPIFAPLAMVDLLEIHSMPRITLAIADREHFALKLLSLQKKKRILALAQEAIKQYLEREGAYQLTIQSDIQSDDSPP